MPLIPIIWSALALCCLNNCIDGPEEKSQSTPAFTWNCWRKETGCIRLPKQHLSEKSVIHLKNSQRMNIYTQFIDSHHVIGSLTSHQILISDGKSNKGSTRSLNGLNEQPHMKNTQMSSSRFVLLAASVYGITLAGTGIFTKHKGVGRKAH